MTNEIKSELFTTNYLETEAELDQMIKAMCYTNHGLLKSKLVKIGIDFTTDAEEIKKATEELENAKKKFHQAHLKAVIRSTRFKNCMFGKKLLNGKD